MEFQTNQTNQTNASTLPEGFLQTSKPEERKPKEGMSCTSSVVDEAYYHEVYPISNEKAAGIRREYLAPFAEHPSCPAKAAAILEANARKGLRAEDRTVKFQVMARAGDGFEIVGDERKFYTPSISAGYVSTMQLGKMVTNPAGKKCNSVSRVVFVVVFYKSKVFFIDVGGLTGFSLKRRSDGGSVCDYKSTEWSRKCLSLPLGVDYIFEVGPNEYVKVRAD